MLDIWPYLLRIRPETLFAAGLVLATLVTVNVLLRKRGVRSAVGWIGLAWLAPDVGTTLYPLLGIDRVQRRARQLRPAADRLGQSVPHGDG